MPLHWASLKGPRSVCELLVEYGAEADAKNRVCQENLQYIMDLFAPALMVFTMTDLAIETSGI